MPQLSSTSKPASAAERRRLVRGRVGHSLAEGRVRPDGEPNGRVSPKGCPDAPPWP
jgi:hypothetical protein